MRSVSFALCAAFLVAGACFADPLSRNVLDSDARAWFYNRVGTSAAQAESDRKECAAYAAGVVPDDSGPFAQMLNGAMFAGDVAAATDDCMMAKGYRRFGAPDHNLAAFKARFDAMDASSKEALVSAEAPTEGVVERSWDNSLWLSSPNDPPASTTQRGAMVATTNDARHHVFRPVDAGAAIQPQAGDAVFVVTLHADHRADVLFSRDKLADGGADQIPIGRGRPQWPILQAHTEAGAPASVQVFVAPAGSYNLASVGYRSLAGTGYEQFCFGTFGFTAAPGAVVYLGDFTVQNVVLPPTGRAESPIMRVRVDTGDIEAARTALAGAPQLAAQLTRADYSNGRQHVCENPWHNGVGYGIDLPGAPWRESH